ncbi:MAG TPA: class I SAM-dependent methyltransferase [Pseudorhodoplanes sp.]|nr:class I SAM-dependent methyltransferase [Pseudorhodoplanes sp.]
MEMTAAIAMDRMYRRQRHVYDFTRRYYLLGRDLLIRRLNPASGDHVLEIGCGTGRNLVAAARRYKDAQFLGIDISREMLKSSGRAIAQADLQSRVRVAFADAADIDPSALLGRPKFARIFISYSLSMIPDWPRVLDGAIRLLADGGELHIVDFGRQEHLPRWFRNALRQWLALFHVHPRDEMERTLMALAGRVNARVSIERPYLGYAQYALLRLYR